MNKIEFELNGKSGIYQLKNLVNNKKYIGSSCNLYARLYDHMYNMNHNHGHNAHLQAAWNKYGANNFEYTILEYCDPEIRLDREQYYIDDIKPEYNLCLNVIGNLNRIVSKETRDKISQTLKTKYALKEIETYKQQHNWKQCWIYNIYTNELVKECEYFTQAIKFLGYKTLPGNNPKKHRYKKKYCILFNNIEDPLQRLNYISENFIKCKSKHGKYLLAENNGYIEYFLSVAECSKKFGFCRTKLIEHPRFKNNPLMIDNTLIYFSNTFIPIDRAVPFEESKELLSGNIGETPGMDNTEINSEIKKSESSYSVDGETFKWKQMNLLESGCYSCEIPRTEEGVCKCPKYPCSNYSGYYKRI